MRMTCKDIMPDLLVLSNYQKIPKRLTYQTIQPHLFFIFASMSL